MDEELLDLPITPLEFIPAYVLFIFLCQHICLGHHGMREFFSSDFCTFFLILQIELIGGAV